MLREVFTRVSIALSPAGLRDSHWAPVACSPGPWTPVLFVCPSTFPGKEKLMLDVQHIANAPSDKIPQVIKGLRFLVKGGHRRQNNRSSLRGRRHIAQLDQVERRLAHDQYQWPLLLQTDISSSLNQTCSRTPGDTRQRFDRARHHCHSVDRYRTAGDDRRQISSAVFA